MVIPAEILTRYGAIVGDEHVSRATVWKSSSDGVWHAPTIVLSPRTTEEISRIVQQANLDRIPIVPAGGGTGYSGGVATPNGGILVDTRRMSDILNIDEKQGLVRTQAGIIVAELNRQLQSQDLWWPHDPGSRALATVGGTISVRGTGTYFTKYGAAPDTVYGLLAVLADGTTLSIDARPRGRVSGYDLLSLFLSSEGTLGIITEAVLKICKRPARNDVRLVGFASLAEAERYVCAVLESGVIPETLLVESRDRITNEFEWKRVTPSQLGASLAEAQWIVVLSIAGEHEFVKSISRKLTSTAMISGGHIVDDAVTEAYWERKTGSLTTDRTSLPAYHVADFSIAGVDLRKLADIYDRVTGMFDLRRKGIRFYIACPRGDVVCSAQIYYDQDDKAAATRAREWNRSISREVAKCGGSISSILGIGVRLIDDLQQERTPREVDIMKALKTSIDPNAIMNPGKLFAGPSGLNFDHIRS